MTMNDFSTALITGASSGIGYELAKIFAIEGHNLVLVARDEDKLLELAGQVRHHRDDLETRVIVCDLSDPTAPESIYETLAAESVNLDILVNNAGIGCHGAFHQLDRQFMLDMVQVNVHAVVHLTHLFLPGMVERGKGKVLNVASTAAFQPGPFASNYYASKSFVLSFTEALAVELEGSGVTATALCPGLTRTNFHARMGVAELGSMKSMFMSAEAVARAGYAGLMKGKTIVIPGFKNALLAKMVRFFPRKFIARSIARLQKQRR
ncbi:SDR family oxidoreductase [bacterium]|nr:SDR family oxidoreductase [bacterium]